MPDIKSIIINTPSEALEDVLSPFIEEQFPSFMRSDHRKLVLFIKAYYEWMEQTGNVGFVSRKLDSVIDIDNNLNQFYDHFQSTYMHSFPEVLAVSTDAETPNKQTLLKKIKNFYGSKGTESAFRFLFRVLYDSDVHFEYAKKHILKASDGQWIEEISIKVTRKNESYHETLIGGRVYQLTATNEITASADIERVQKYYQNGIPVTELYLTNLIGNFSPNGTVTLDNPSVPQLIPFTEQSYSVLGEFFVETQGENYLVGDVVYISSNGVGFVAKVSQTGLAGSVKRIGIENSGINYYDTLTGIVVSSNGSNNTARITLQATAVTRYPGYYSGNRGKISSTQKLYDGDEYQDYSYRLKSAVSIDRYYAVLRELIHPAGMKMFGSVLLEYAVSSIVGGSTQVTRIGGTSLIVIGAYTPYTFGTTLDLRSNGVTLAGSWIINDGGISYGKTGDLYPVGYNPYISGTADTGPAGLTTSPSGTTFNRGGSGGFLGYTYCSVPEGGRTAHNPLGGALGGVTAWRGKKESVLEPDMVGFSPEIMVGLTLWLKPENIGVCGGSMTTGRSMDIWRDASASQNHALPPKWDYWDNETVLNIKQNITTGSWANSVWNTNPCDNIEFRLGPYAAPLVGVSQAAGNVFMVGFWGAGATGPLGTGGNANNAGYHRLDFSFYVQNINTNSTALTYIELGRTGGSSGTIYAVSTGSPGFSASTIFGISHDQTANTIKYYRKETPTSTPTVIRTFPVGVSAGEVFYADSSWYGTSKSACQITKAQYNQSDIPISGWTSTINMLFGAVKGVTIDKLRPTLVVADRGIPGRTGIQFNGGVLYGPHTVWTQAGLCGGYVGVTLGAVAAPIGSGNGLVGDRIQSGQHFNLTRGITLTKDMTIFVAFRAGSTAAGYTQSNHGLGLVSSSKRLAAFSPSVERSRTDLLGTDANNLTSTSLWLDDFGGTGIAPTRTASVFAPNETTTATRFLFNKGAGTTTTDRSVIVSAGLTWTVGAQFGGFIWMRSVTGTPTIILRHASGNAYQALPLTTTWQKFYIPQTAAITTGNFTFGLRGGGLGTTDNTATVDVWQPQLFNELGLTPFDSETDHLLYHRSYSDIDADAAKQTSAYYPVRSDTFESFYPYESGLVGLRNNVGSTASSRIAYNPNLSTLNGISTDDITIGEWNRQKDGRIRSFYSGLESRNYSANTSRRIARPDSPGGIGNNNAATEVSYNTDSFNIGRFGAYCLPVLDSPWSDSTASSSFVASALLNPSYSFNGVIYEVIVYDRVLSETERQTVYSYLSRKYKAETVMPSVYVSSRPSAFGLTSGYWNIAKHPNSSGSSKIVSGASMGAISVEDFTAIYGYVYKSAGTRLADGSILTTDTYILLGQ